jgi:hypothetical protein
VSSKQEKQAAGVVLNDIDVSAGEECNQKAKIATRQTRVKTTRPCKMPSPSSGRKDERGNSNGQTNLYYRHVGAGSQVEVRRRGRAAYLCRSLERGRCSLQVVNAVSEELAAG